MNIAPGTVYLVGAGPGDPGLITVRGMALLRQADVIIHDRLVARELLDESKPGAEIIDAGKTPGTNRHPQTWINALLVDRAASGRSVVRLKGGDPFIFGRGFEELAACREAGVNCVVVPGVTSAVAAPAAAGIPLTIRGLVRSVAIITGQVAEHTSGAELDFRALTAIDTIVVLMGRASLGELTRALIRAGHDPAVPAACVQQATTPFQRTVFATLGTIAGAVEREECSAPAVIVIGRVVAAAVHGPAPAAPVKNQQ